MFNRVVRSISTHDSYFTLLNYEGPWMMLAAMTHPVYSDAMLENDLPLQFKRSTVSPCHWVSTDRLSLSHSGAAPPWAGTAGALTLKFGSTPFKMASFNLHKLSKNSPKETNQAKAAIVTSLNPDLLFLQESGDAQTFRWWVETFLPPQFQHWAFVDSVFTEDEMGMGIIYNPERVCNLVVIPHLNPNDEHVERARPYPEVHFDLDNRVHLAGISAHLSGIKKIRRAESLFLRERLDDLTQTEPYVFVMGDFNMDPYQPKDRRARAYMRYLREGNDEEGVGSGDEMVDVFDPKAHPVSHKRGVKLDHILMSSQLRRFVDEESTQVIGSFDEPPYSTAESDHLPISTAIGLPDPVKMACSAVEEFRVLIQRAMAGSEPTEHTPLLTWSG